MKEKTEVIHFRIPHSAFEVLRAKAEKIGKSPGNYVRELTLEDLNQEGEELCLRDEMREVSRRLGKVEEELQVFRSDFLDAVK